MNKTQFWVLNIICLVLVALLITQFAFSNSNVKLSNKVSQQQAVINNARQLEPILDQLAKRIARSSDTNAAMRDLLVKYEMRVTLEVDGKEKKFP